MAIVSEFKNSVGQTLFTTVMIDRDFFSWECSCGAVVNLIESDPDKLLEIMDNTTGALLTECLMCGKKYKEYDDERHGALNTNFWHHPAGEKSPR